MPSPATSSVCRIIPKSDRGCTLPSTTKSALKILCRQCSELACANIMSSTSVGLRQQPGERLDEVVDLVVGQGQAVCRVRLLDRGAPSAQHVDVLHRLGVPFVEEPRRVPPRRQRRLRHPVVEHVGAGRPLLLGERPVGTQVVLGDPLDAADVDSTAVGDVRGLARPRGQGAEPRCHDDAGEVTTLLVTGIRLAVAEEPARPCVPWSRRARSRWPPSGRVGRSPP